jgi:hypothetical protein
MYWQFLAVALVGAALANPVPANIVKEHVVFSGDGAADTVGNGFGCAHSTLATIPPGDGDTAHIRPTVTPDGANHQLACVKHVFTDGFTVSVKE